MQKPIMIEFNNHSGYRITSLVRCALGFPAFEGKHCADGRCDQKLLRSTGFEAGFEMTQLAG
jgi:hypothetical protein